TTSAGNNANPVPTLGLTLRHCGNHYFCIAIMRVAGKAPISRNGHLGKVPKIAFVKMTKAIIGPAAALAIC
ncbi:MAG: hypothetical protein N3A66_10700, partial [Planctomycetota bacterium]|nr:hypothetical protein [Planctomycetota bacterium]